MNKCKHIVHVVVQHLDQQEFKNKIKIDCTMAKAREVAYLQPGLVTFWNTCLAAIFASCSLVISVSEETALE